MVTVFYCLKLVRCVPQLMVTEILIVTALRVSVSSWLWSTHGYRNTDSYTTEVFSSKLIVMAHSSWLCQLWLWGKMFRKNVSLQFQLIMTEKLIVLWNAHGYSKHHNLGKHRLSLHGIWLNPYKMLSSAQVQQRKLLCSHKPHSDVLLRQNPPFATRAHPKTGWVRIALAGWYERQSRFHLQHKCCLATRSNELRLGYIGIVNMPNISR